MAATDLAHYRIVEAIGRGAMGEVYRAVDQRLGRQVALKVLPADVEGDPDWQDRMLREARAASALNHPGIVTLHDLASAGGRTFLVMELVLGESFSRVAARGVAWPRALTLVAAVADALAAAHAVGVLHRDVKSDNLMVSHTGQVKVLDFGLAALSGEPAVAGAAPKLAAGADLAATVVPLAPLAVTQRPGGSAFASRTREGSVIGTPAYLAPEGYEGVVDARSEVFSLGVVLHELLTGQRPFDRPTAIATMAAIRLDEPEPPSKVAPDRELPRAVDDLVRRALAKAPADRFPDMAAFAAALRAALPGPAAARRSRWRTAAIALAALGGAAGLLAIGARLASRKRDAPPPPASAARDTAPAMAVTGSRRLTLATGCEEYPRFTPDGTRVIHDAFVDGDTELVSIARDGSDVRRLTRVPGWDYAAAIAPGGTRLAYIHEAPDGRTVRLRNLADPPESPGRDLGAISGYPAWIDDRALVVGDLAGRIVRWDLADDGAVARTTVLGTLPAGARAYHVAMVEGAGVVVLWFSASMTDASGLGELSLDGTLRVIEEASTDYEGALVPSAAGRGYYVTRRGATTGNQLLWRTWGGGDAVVVPGGLSPRAGLDVARDGKALVFSTCADRQYLAHVRSGEPPVALASGTWNDAHPTAFGPGRLLVNSDRRGNHQGWIVDLAGGEPIAVTPPDGHSAAPSPDGTLVVYAADGGRGGLALAPVGGGDPRPLTADRSDADPVFTRDGAHVVYVRTLDGAPEVRVIAIADGTQRPLGAGAQPTTSPTDDAVVFLSPEEPGGVRTLLLVERPGDPPHPVPGVPAATWQHPRFSPDGKRLLAVRGYQEVVEITRDGSAPPRVVWDAGDDSVQAAIHAPDGDGLIVAVAAYEGDLWLAEGTFAPR